MNHELAVYVAIAGMACVTYGTRASGLWLARRVTPSGRLAAGLATIPGAVLIAIVVPAALDAGVIGLVGVAVTAVVAVRSGNVLAAMVSGVLAVWLLRLWF